jgi:hypothetical protein
MWISSRFMKYSLTEEEFEDKDLRVSSVDVVKY